MKLFEIAGEEFYFDLKSISDFVRVDEEDDKSFEDLLKKEEEIPPSENDGEDEIIESVYIEPQGPMVDVTKWELTKGLIEAILSENNVVDETMGIAKLEGQLSISFRIAFNTLIKHKLIKINRS